MSLKDNMNKIREGFAGLVEEGAREIERIVEEGEKRFDKLTQQAQSYTEMAEREYKAFEGKIFTDGSYDPQKAKRLLSQVGEKYPYLGGKAAGTLSDLLNEGAIKAKIKYHELVPTSEELSGKYVNIGTDYKGILFRHHYEDCLTFHEMAKEKIPENVPFRNQILKDVKSSASASMEELSEYYTSKDPADKALRKLSISLQYLQPSEDKHQFRNI